MYLICINHDLGRYMPLALVNTNQIHHFYTCYNYHLYHMVRIGKYMYRLLLGIYFFVNEGGLLQ